MRQRHGLHFAAQLLQRLNAALNKIAGFALQGGEVLLGQTDTHAFDIARHGGAVVGHRSKRACCVHRIAAGDRL
jgi:hypothetical protein